MKILIIRNFPSYMSVKNNTYNIQEVGLAKALVRKGHICDIVFWTDKEEEIVEVPVDNMRTVRVFYRHGKNILKMQFIFNVMSYLHDMIFYNLANTTKCKHGYWQKNILKKQLYTTDHITVLLIKDTT